MNADLTGLIVAAPEILVLAMACAILLVDLYVPKDSSVAYALAQLTLIAAAAGTAATGSRTGFYFNGMFVIDPLAGLLKFASYSLTVFVFPYSRDYLRRREMLRGEYFVLGLFGVVGMMVMVSASNFLPLYLGLELLSLSLYSMVAFQRDSST